MSSLGIGGISYSGGAGGIILAAGYSEDIKFYDTVTGEMIKTIGGPGSRVPGVEGVGLPAGGAQYGNVIDGHVNCLELTPDDRFVAAAGNPWVRIFDCEYTTAPYSSYEGGHRDNVTSVSFEEDAKWFVTSSEDGTAKVWDRRAPVDDEKSFQLCFKNQQPDGSGGAIHCSVLHPNQAEVLCGDASGQVAVWDLTANRAWTEVPDSGGSPIKSIAVAPTYADPSSDDVTVVAANHKGFCFSWRVSGDQHDTTPPQTPEVNAQNGLENDGNGVLDWLLLTRCIAAAPSALK
ncbi:Target of rapamycin complex subunit lst8, partial [Perkinsus olseni]